MPDFKLEIAKIVGTPSTGSWSQVHTFFPEDREKLEKRGKLLAVISLESVEAGIETVALGREILSRLHEEYFGNLEGGVLERLKMSLVKVQSEWSGTQIVAGIVFSFNDKQVLYLGILGKGKVLIKRAGSLNEILSGQDDSGIEVGSGLLEENDILLLGNESFFQIVSSGVIKAALGLSNPQEMVESLAPIVLSQSQVGQPAAVIGTLNAFEEISEGMTSFIAPEKPEEKIAEAKPKIIVRFKEILGNKISQLKGKILVPASFRVRHSGEEKEKSKKVTVTVAVILIVLFLISIFLGFNNKRKQDQEAKAKILFNQAQSKYNEARQIIDLDSIGAQALLKESLKILEQAKKLSATKEILTLSEETQKLLTGNEKEAQIQVSIFFDLGLIKEQTKATAVSKDGNLLAILDANKGLLSFLDLEKKSSWFLADENLTKGQLIYFTEDKVYVFTSEGIFLVDTGQKKMNKIISQDNSWGKIVGISSFGDNVYLLDSAKNTIWQYVKEETGYSSAKSWLASGFPGQSEPLSFSIDGAIWVLGKEGKILKFSRGSQETFETIGIKKEQLTNLESINTDKDSQFIYFLDKIDKKILVFSKDGKFQKQYEWSGEPSGQSLMIPWEQKNKIFLVKDNSVFSFQTN